jgi:hypothetical protein
MHAVGVVMGTASLQLASAPAALARDDSSGMLSMPRASRAARVPSDVRFGLPAFLKRTAASLHPADLSIPSVRALDTVVALQLADGSWKLDNDLARALGWRDAKQLRKALGRSLSGEQEARAAATALALEWLQRDCRDTRDEWRILADKAHEWLARTPEGATVWLDLAKETLARQSS